MRSTRPQHLLCTKFCSQRHPALFLKAPLGFFMLFLMVLSFIAPPAFAQQTLFTTQTPVLTGENDGVSYELGMKFLTRHVTHKSFVCHSYRKTSGVGCPKGIQPTREGVVWSLLEAVGTVVCKGAERGAYQGRWIGEEKVCGCCEWCCSVR
jgi:hypothetical protein